MAFSAWSVVDTDHIICAVRGDSVIQALRLLDDSLLTAKPEVIKADDLEGHPGISEHLRQPYDLSRAALCLTVDHHEPFEVWDTVPLFDDLLSLNRVFNDNQARAAVVEGPGTRLGSLSGK
jgi:hypothetical protein